MRSDLPPSASDFLPYDLSNVIDALAGNAEIQTSTNIERILGSGAR